MIIRALKHTEQAPSVTPPLMFFPLATISLHATGVHKLLFTGRYFLRCRYVTTACKNREIRQCIENRRNTLTF